MSIIIVIVNYKTPLLVIDCLTSLAKEIDTVPAVHVTVVDNGSCDGSPGRIGSAIEAEGWSGWASVVEAGRNLGFAGGNNYAIDAHPGAEYVLLLNSDTIVHGGCLAHCWSVMEKDQSIGAMSCMLLNDDGSVQNVARRFPNPLRQTICAFGLPWRWTGLFGWANCEDMHWDRKTVKRDVDWLGGAFLFIRRSTLNEVGALDEDFFFYGEDIEFSHRLARAGYRRYYDPEVSITHLGGASTAPGLLDIGARGLYEWHARYLVQKKCYGTWAAGWLRGVDIAALALRQIKRVCTGKGRTPEFQRAAEVLRLLARPLRLEAKP